MLICIQYTLLFPKQSDLFIVLRYHENLACLGLETSGFVHVDSSVGFALTQFLNVKLHFYHYYSR